MNCQDRFGGEYGMACHACKVPDSHCTHERTPGSPGGYVEVRVLLLPMPLSYGFPKVPGSLSRSLGNICTVITWNPSTAQQMGAPRRTLHTYSLLSLMTTCYNDAESPFNTAHRLLPWPCHGLVTEACTCVCLCLSPLLGQEVESGTG